MVRCLKREGKPSFIFFFFFFFFFNDNVWNNQKIVRENDLATQF